MKRFSKYALILANFLYSISSYAGEPAEETGNLMSLLSNQTVFEIQGSNNLSGSIAVSSSSDKSIKVIFTKSARAGSESQGRRFLDLIDLRLSTPTDDRAILKILTPIDAPWQGSNYSVNLTISIELPENMSIDGNLRFMEISIAGPFDGVSLKSAFSPIRVNNVIGPVNVSTSFADIDLGSIRGSIEASNEHGSIVAHNIDIPNGSAIFRGGGGSILLDDIRGSVEAYTNFSEIAARNIKTTDGSVVLRTSYGHISADNISGELVCETSFNTIHIGDSKLTHGHSKIETSYSSIDAAFAGISNCELFISNTYSNINLSIPINTSASIVASVDDGGRIYAKNLSIRPSLLDLTRLEGTTGNGESRIELKISGIGVIDLRGQ